MKSKTILIFMCMVLLVGTISAFEFDNVKRYNSDTREITITNSFGLGRDIAKIKLDTPLINNVIRGENRLVAEFTINSYEDYLNVFNSMEFYDVSKSLKEINREFTYRYKVLEGYNNEPIYTEVCEGIREINGTNQAYCFQTQTGTKKIPIYSWNDLDTKVELKEGELTIGIFTDVLPGDKVEWIPTFFGVKINEWAVWVDSLNDDLVAYWMMNESSGTIFDAFGNNDTTGETGITYSETGIIDDALGFVDNDHIDWSDASAFHLQEVTWSLWVYPHDDATTPVLLSFREDVIGSNGLSMLLRTDERVIWLAWGSSGIIYEITSNNAANGKITLNQWNHLVGTHELNNASLYVNGVLQAGTDTNTGVIDYSDYAKMRMGAEGDEDRDYNGHMDEVSVWNRVLTHQEVIDLYNGGSGITYIASKFSVTLNSPEDNFASSTTTEFNCTAQAVGATIVNMSLWTNQSGSFQLENFTTGLSQIRETEIWDHTIGDDGNYLWTCQTCDSLGFCVLASENRTILIDTIHPNVVIISPVGQIDSHTIGNTLNLNWTITDLNLDSCWFEYNDVNTTITCGEGNTTFNTVVNKQNLTIYANDSANNINSSFTKWTYFFLENSITFNGNITETSSQDFEINLTTELTVLSVSALLNYDGDNFTSTVDCDGGECIISNTIDIALVATGESELNDFFWDLTIFNGTDSFGIDTSTNSQNVSKLHLEECNATWETQTLNFTTYDEQSLSLISPFKFGGAFEFWTGKGSIRRNNSFSINDTEIKLCLSPNFTISIEAIIDYDEDGEDTNYTNRFYYFDEFEITNVSQDIFMYLLLSSSSTSFILKVQDENLLPVTDALIEIYRFYPGENKFKLVQVAKTDDNGKTIGFFQTETVDYKFIIKKNDKTLLETGQQKVIPETSPFTLTFNTGEDLGDPWASQKAISNLESSLSFDKDTNIVTYTYIDSSGNFTQSRLFVEKRSLTNASAHTLLCNETSILSSATITCNVTSSGTGFYVASSFITREGEGLDKQISFQIEDFSSVVGLLGLFFGIFLIIIASFMFRFNEIAGIWAITTTIVLVNIMGLIKFGSVFVTGLLGVAIILTWLIEK